MNVTFVINLRERKIRKVLNRSYLSWVLKKIIVYSMDNGGIKLEVILRLKNCV